MKSLNYINKHTKIYPINKTLKYSYSFGLCLAFLIIIQIITGLFLSSFYIPCAQLAESSINYITIEITNGYLIQRLHVIIASILFICLYLHFFRAIFYKMYSWNNRITWWSGLGLLYLCIVEAFTGYILPWGQMSFWGATVITNLFSIIPIIGTTLIKFIWGGSTVGSLTLERFFMVHYLLPSLLISLILMHLASLHKIGSTNIFRSSKIIDLNFIQLYPYFLIKDFLFLLGIIFIITFLVCFNPDCFDNLVNNVSADSKITPKHIVPEWYFLSFYIILKLILVKWIGIVIMFFFIIFPVFLPFITK